MLLRPRRRMAQPAAADEADAEPPQRITVGTEIETDTEIAVH